MNGGIAILICYILYKIFAKKKSKNPQPVAPKAKPVQQKVTPIQRPAAPKITNLNVPEDDEDDIAFKSALLTGLFISLFNNGKKN